MADVTIQKDGRKWSVGDGGIKSLKRKYIIVLDSVTAANGEAASFSNVPAIGSAHPSHTHLYVESYDVEEGEDNKKKILTIYVNYAYRTIETTGSGQDAVTSQVEEWGWDAGTDEREMIDAVNGAAVLNSAGDVFDRVPTISAPAPTFTKVMKFQQRQTGWESSFCCVNSSSITIGGITCPAASLLCTVSEKRIIGDPVWKYRYTVQLKYRRNPVKLASGNTATDIGWDVAITDAGMRELDANGQLRLIKSVDTETGKKCTVTSPELLDGSGHAVERSSGSTPTAYNIRFQAYARVSFPSWFYSEPT